MLGVEDDGRAERLVDALGAMLRVPGNPPLPPPGEDEGPLGSAIDALFERRRAPLRRELATEIESRGAGRSDREDVIESLFAAEPRPSIEEMVDEIETLLMAAQEPPSIALAWLLDALARHPRLADDFLLAGPGSPLCEAVLHESLRLRPSALAALRRLREPLRVASTSCRRAPTPSCPCPSSTATRASSNDRTPSGPSAGSTGPSLLPSTSPSAAAPAAASASPCPRRGRRDRADRPPIPPPDTPSGPAASAWSCAGTALIPHRSVCRCWRPGGAPDD